MSVAFAKHAAIAAAAGMALTAAAPASAAEPMQSVSVQYSHVAPASDFGQLTAEHHRRKHKRGHYHHADHYYGDRGYYDDDRRYYDEPIYRDTRIWRGRDGRYYCRKENGTTGLLIGAGVGGLIGNEVAGRGDKALGTLLGAVGGAILGREIDRSNSRCR